jgi:hypothetical protein
MLLFSFFAAVAIVLHSRLSSIYLREVPPSLAEMSQLGLFAFYADVITTVGAFIAVAGFLLMANLAPRKILLTLAVIALVFFGSLVYGIPLTVKAQSGPIVIIRNHLFSGGYTPPRIVVVVGVNSTVTWINDRDSIHPDVVVSDDRLFDSGLIRQGQSWTYTFTAAGVYSYHSAIHFWMTGVVVVVG